jgi:plasmid stability protein
MVSITLDNVPDEVHQALRTRAERSGRTIPREAVECLHSVLTSPSGNLEIDAVRKLRDKRRYLPRLTDDFLRRAIDEGRP